jgi:hypothetical protein
MVFLPQTRIDGPIITLNKDGPDRSARSMLENCEISVAVINLSYRREKSLDEAKRYLLPG